MANDPFRVRLHDSDAPENFRVVVVKNASPEQIKLAIATIFSIRHPYVLRKVRDVGPPIVYEPGNAPFHSGLSGPHEAVVVGKNSVKATQYLLT